MAVARYLDELHISYTLVDRYGAVGGAFRRMYGQMILSSPAKYLRLPDAEPPRFRNEIHAHEYAEYLQDYADRFNIVPLCLEVTKIVDLPFGFAVRFGTEQQAIYSVVVVCTGSFDKPKIPLISGLTDRGVVTGSGIPSIHACDWEGPNRYKTGHLLIIGGGPTAIELAEECVRFGLRPIVSHESYRGKTFPVRMIGLNPRPFVYEIMRRMPAKVFRHQCLEGWRYRGVDRGYESYRNQGLLQTRPPVDQVKDQTVAFIDGSSDEVANIVFATGYRWDMPFLPDWIPKGQLGNPLVTRGECPAQPGLFFVGIMCAFSASSHFIHGIVDDAKRVAEAIHMRKHIFSVDR
jgi:putative flavoprotein involved in K+ transport